MRHLTHLPPHSQRTRRPVFAAASRLGNRRRPLRLGQFQWSANGEGCAEVGGQLVWCVGLGRFELPTFGPPDRRANQAAPQPVKRRDYRTPPSPAHQRLVLPNVCCQAGGVQVMVRSREMPWTRRQARYTPADTSSSQKCHGMRSGLEFGEVDGASCEERAGTPPRCAGFAPSDAFEPGKGVPSRWVGAWLGAGSSSGWWWGAVDGVGWRCWTGPAQSGQRPRSSRPAGVRYFWQGAHQAM